MVRYADDFVVLVQGTLQDAEEERLALAQFLKEELRMELSMEKTRITDVREGFDFLGYRVAQEKLPSTGRHVGMLFIPKGKSQLLRNKIKAKVKETPTGVTLADLIDDLNPVVIGWRNYYRYAYSGMEGVRQARLVAVLARKILARQETRQSVRRKAAPYICRAGREAQRLATARQGTRPVRRRQAAAVPGPGPTHTERMERHPGRRFRKGADKFWEATRALASL